MEYFKDGKEFTLREVKAIHRNVSFKSPTQLGYTSILPTPKPEVGELEQAIKDGTTTDANGNIVRAWKVVDMFSDYTNDEGIVVTKAEQEAEYLTKKIEDKAKSAEALVQSHINSTVKGLGYDDENSIAKYLVDTNPFYIECKALSLWIGSVWVAVHGIQADVMAGNRTDPTLEELIAELPVYGA